ncbi:hypothetical protein HELRODRAFT_109284 [Helobdella robusta]|uniref:BROMI C-terminal Rab TBC-like domain-containing protein n=1 Tax=Helobdella robusta TaxID=6412 RepID=T1EES1_HELRO|nr:hypothetical protein HELRODRAFT_109284 [Helobdella robusta]ESO11021.1 hypothetical protein HELRODRAFT_109284 [Helobdella robusta]
MICCLDTMLLLHCRFDFQRLLMSRQKEKMLDSATSTTTSSSSSPPSSTVLIMMDDHSLQHNHILVRSFLIGGYSERLLPDTQYSDKPIRMFHEYPVPDCYWPKLSKHSTTDGHQQQLPKIKDHESFVEFREVIFDVIGRSSRDASGLKDSYVMMMIEQAVEYNASHENNTSITNRLRALSPRTHDINVSDSAAKKYTFSKIQLEGIKLIIRYGTSLRLLTSSTKESTEKLKLLIAKVSMAFCRGDNESDGFYNIAHNVNLGFDWFAGVLFILSNGNVNRTLKFLSKFASLHTSIYLWKYYSMICNNNNNKSNLATIQHVINNSLEMILQEELPQVLSTFHMSGFAPAQICQHWIRQWFLNYLDWPQIQQSLICSLCFGPDYIVYFCISILKHNEEIIKRQMVDRNLVIYLKEEPIRDFDASRYVDYMISLEDKYRSHIFRNMRDAYGKVFGSQ